MKARHQRDTGSREREEFAETARTVKTPEQRRAEAEQLHDTITLQVEALRDSEAWTRYFGFSRAFHRYSLNNLFLMLDGPRRRHTWPVTGRGRRSTGRSGK